MPFSGWNSSFSGGEQQHRARDHRLPRLVAVEVLDLADLSAVEIALERLAVLLDRLHVALDVVGLLRLPFGSVSPPITAHVRRRTA
jgi:hypothetical protein